MSRILSSTEPPETPLRPGLTTAQIRVVVHDLEDLAPSLAAAGEHELAADARSLSSRLWARITRQSGEHSVSPPHPPRTPNPNTGV